MKKAVLLMIAALVLMSVCSCSFIKVVDVDENGTPVAIDGVPISAMVQTESAPEEPDEPEDPDLYIAEEPPAPVEEEPEPEVPEEEPGEVFPMIGEEDPMYASVMDMYRALAPVAEYYSFFDMEPDLFNINNEEYWDMTAMIAAACAPADHYDQTGNVNLNWEELTDYAQTFFGEFFDTYGIPEWEDTHSAYADPRSSVVNLSAVAVDGYEDELLGFWEDSSTPGVYVYLVEVRPEEEEGVAETESSAVETTADADNEKSSLFRWELAVEAWNDDAPHAFAYRLIGIEKAEVPEAAAEETGSAVSD